MQLHVFVSSLFAVETWVLENDPKSLADCVLFVAGIQSVQLDFSAGWIEQSSKHFDSCRFAGSVRAQEGEYLALLHVKRNVLHCTKFAEFFEQIFDLDHGFQTLPKGILKKQTVSFRSTWYDLSGR